jgi:hypothetical protein
MKTLIVGLGRATWEQDKGSTVKKTTHTYSILNYPQFSIVGGVDRDYSQCVSWSQEFSLPSQTNLKKAIIELEPELIVVAVPIAKLTEVLQQVLGFSLAVVLIEKPVASNLQDLQSLKNLDSEFSRILVNLPRLLAPETIWLRNFVQGREFNQVTVSGSYSGAPINTGLHFISLMDYFFEKLEWKVRLSRYGKSFDFRSPSGLVSGTFQHDISRSDSSFQFEMKSDDYRVSYLEGGSSLAVFEGSAFRNIQTTRARYQDNVYRELAEKGISSTLDSVGLNVIIKSIYGLLS